ncbi:MAG: DUF1638 domain-containing protein [Oscillospiraceae bacterium]|jgi:hypothetical protein|nr:DUF1638 domain-containing protein [Oscillospiraceae bacterium]
MEKPVPLLSCGIFKYELEAIRPDLERELGTAILADFLPPALDVNFNLLESALRGKLTDAKEPAALLYGSMCHPNMPALTADLNAILPKPSNCMGMFVPPERLEQLSGGENIFFLTLGGLRQWKDIYLGGHGWDEVDARMNFGYIDRIILLDSGILEYSDEDLFEFFEFTQTPIEVEPINLDYFKANVIALCRQVMP